MNGRQRWLLTRYESPEFRNIGDGYEHCGAHTRSGGSKVAALSPLWTETEHSETWAKVADKSTHDSGVCGEETGLACEGGEGRPARQNGNGSRWPIGVGSLT